MVAAEGEAIGDGRFMLLEPLGSGCVGRVWRARDTVRGGEVAVKLLAPEAPRSVGEAFERVARALREVRSPAVVRVHDVGRVGGEHGSPFVVTDLVPSRVRIADIAEALRDDKAAAVLLFVQAAKGLDAIHRARVLHRAVRPSNLFVVPGAHPSERTLLVADFGLASPAPFSLAEASADEAVLFAAPEQLTLGFVDRRADVYGLGATMYAALTGRAPHDRASLVAWLAARVESPAARLPVPRPPSEVERSVPAALSDIVMCCLEERVEKRFRTMLEVERALEAVLRDELRDDLDGQHGEPKDRSARARSELAALVAASFLGDAVLDSERRFFCERARALGVPQGDVDSVVAEVLTQAGCRIVRSRPRTAARRVRSGSAAIKSGGWTVSPEKHAFDLAVYQLMKDIHEVFEEFGVKYYAIWGTLMGALRHGGFIPWDDDLDLCVADAEMERFEATIPRLEALGYTVYFWEDIDGWKIERRFDLPEVFGRRPAIFCDIFRARTGDDGFLRYTGGWHYGWNFPFPPEIVFPRTRARFGATSIWCPRFGDRYLDIEIGGEWRTEAVRYNHHFPEISGGRFVLEPEDYLPAGPFGPLEERVHPP